MDSVKLRFPSPVSAQPLRILPGGCTGPSNQILPRSDRTYYQEMFDTAVTDPRKAAIGQYVKTEVPGQGWVLRKKGVLGGGTILIKPDGSVSSKPVIYGAEYREILGPGSVNPRRKLIYYI